MHSNDNKRSLLIGESELIVDLCWKHERQYYSYVIHNIITGSVACDIGCAKRLIMQGDTVLDAGANIGFTCLQFLAHGAATVHAVEPCPILFHRLSSIESSKLRPYSCALSDWDGSAPLYFSTSHNQGHSLELDTVHSFPAVFTQLESTPVAVRKIDTLFQGQHFDIIKIDVEGSEARLVRGAAGLLRESSPRILMIEIRRPHFAETHAILTKHFKHYRRAIVHRSSGKVIFVCLDKVSTHNKEQFYFSPPFFVYAHNSDSFDS